MAETLWKLVGVTLGGSPARLDDVTVAIDEGVTAVLGPSGAGKTSLLNLLVGYERPDRGAVITTVVKGERALPVYWAPQTAGLWPHLTVREHVTLAMPRSDQEKAMALLDALDVAARAAARPDELSEGERSRVAVARALAADAAVLVMDEPFASVDVARVSRYWQVVRDHLAATGASLVFATHRPDAVLAEAARVLCLRGGRLIYEGPVADLYWHPRSPDEAACLGECNWLSPEECRLWLARDEEADRCFRPEQISVEPADDGPVVVEATRFKGSVAEAELRHEATGQRRRFLHRPPAHGLAEGARVVIRVLVALVLVVLAGCGSEDPALSFSEVRYWSMPPQEAKLPAPRALAIGRKGQVLALDTGGRVLIFSSDGTLTGQWRMPESDVGQPEGLCMLADGRVAVADTHYSRVLFFDRNGIVLKKLGSQGEEPGQFIYPVAVVQDPSGHLYVSEYGGNDRVQKFTPGGEFILSFGSFGTRDGQFQRPGGLAWHDGKVYVADAFNNRILVFADGGDYLGVLGGSDRPLSLRFPYDITMGADGALYVIEYGAGRLTKVSLEGRVLGRFGATGKGDRQFHTPWGLTVDGAGHVLIADTGNRRIVELVP